MKNGMVPHEDTQRFAGLIYDESKAMRALIDHVRRCRGSTSPRSSGYLDAVDLLGSGEQSRTRDYGSPTKRSVRVSVWGRAPSSQVTRRSSRRCSTTLIENGIRYNHEGGSVSMRISNETGRLARAVGRGFDICRAHGRLRARRRGRAMPGARWSFA